jgi:hypothetical protein
VTVSKCKLELVELREVRWESTELAGEYTFFYGKGNENQELGTGSFVYKRVEFVSDYLMLPATLVPGVHFDS